MDRCVETLAVASTTTTANATAEVVGVTSNDSTVGVSLAVGLVVLLALAAFARRRA